MTDQIANEIADRMVQVRSRFIRHQAYQQMCDRIGLVESRRRGEIKAGVNREVEGIAIVGASGAGKSEALKVLRNRMNAKQRSHMSEDIGCFLSITSPSPGSLKFVATELLAAMGCPIQGNINSMKLWSLVRHHLEMHRIMFVHIDEAHDFIQNQSGREFASVLRTIKTLTQTQSWPVSVILSGTQDLESMIKTSREVENRFSFIRFEPLSFVSHGDGVPILIEDLAKIGGVDVAEDLTSADFTERLLVAASYQFGLLIKAIADALEISLTRGSAILESRDFQKDYTQRKGAIPALNPFITNDFRDLAPPLISSGKE
ncbi:TniB family NTP-binding protein [Aliiroseovarius sp. 2305UL8-7]|uniref:TniB family NTP-binding protein n=1 Tax=Aliiroseovarius conchicola TaxID=3121637 RepID=UPI0035281F6E